MAEFRCKYAFDKNDEDCKDCDGITMMVDGKEHKCTECVAFEKGEEIKETPMPEPTQVEAKEEKPKKEQKSSTKKSSKTQKNEKSTIKNTTKEENRENDANLVSQTDDNKIPDGVNVGVIRYMSGMTLVHKDVYYKISAEEEWHIDPEKVSPEQVQEVRDKLWAKVNGEVDKQVEEIKTL